MRNLIALSAALACLSGAAWAGPPCTVPNAVGSYNFDTCGNQVVNTGAPGSGGTVTANPPAVTPASGTASAIVTGGTAVTMVTGPVNGGYICNPLSASDQNIATAEVAYINPVGTATTNGRGNTATIQPGGCFNIPPLKTGSNVSVNAATSSHAFNVVVW